MARQTYRDDQDVWRIMRRPDDPSTVLDVIERMEDDVAAGTRLPPSPKVLDQLLDTARRDGGKPTSQMMKRLMVLARQCALTREDRIELAEVLLRRDITSWNDLTNEEARALGFAMEGFAYICHVQAREGRRWREERAAKSAAAGRKA